MNENFTKILFEVGKEYRTREGKPIVVIRNNMSGEYPILGVNSKRVIVKYKADGSLLGKEFPNREDLLIK
jgi:hypothetical protein